MPFWSRKKKGSETEREADSAIDEILHKGRHAAERMLKLVLLGAGGSGKSTVLKQMVRLHSDDMKEDGGGFAVSAADALGCVRKNVVEDIIDISKQCVKMCGEGRSEFMPSNETVVILVREWSQLSYADDIDLTEDLAKAVVLWWSDEAIVKSFDERKKSHVMDNTPYFMNKVVELSHPDYEVTFDDWVRLRHRTTGIIPVTFPVAFSGEVWLMEVTDVGGQRSERKKWLSIFSDVNAVIYIMSLSAYDQVVFEDHTTNCYTETLNLFSDTVNISAFDMTDFIVFLNKWDLFEEKIKTSPFTLYDPKWPEDKANDCDAVAEHVKSLFEQAFNDASTKKKVRSKRHIHFHRTCAIDDKAIETVILLIQLESIRSLLEKAAML